MENIHTQNNYILALSFRFICTSVPSPQHGEEALHDLIMCIFEPDIPQSRNLINVKKQAPEWVVRETELYSHKHGTAQLKLHYSHGKRFAFTMSK